MIKKQSTIFIMILFLLLASGLIGCGAGDTVKQDEAGDVMEESLSENQEKDSQADLVPSEKETILEIEETSLEDGSDLYDYDPVSFNLSDLPEMENKLYAQWEGNIYFRQYSDEDVEKGALWANFDDVPDTEKELMCLTSDGEIVQVGTDYGCGTMFIVDGRLYSQRYTTWEDGEKNRMGYTVYSCNLDGSDVKEYAAENVLAVRGSRIICDGNWWSKPMLTVIDTRTGQEKILVEGESYYLGSTEEEIFYYVQEETGDDIHYDTVFYSVDYEGNIRKVTTITVAECLDLEPINEDSPYAYIHAIQIPQFMILGDDLYFSAGYYAGSANMFQGGGIYHVKKDGSDREVLAATYTEYFYVYDDETNRTLYCRPADRKLEAGKMAAIGLWGETPQDIHLREPYDTYMKPYVHGSTNSILSYPDTSGICYVLLTSRDSENLSIETYVDGGLNQSIKDIEYLNGKLFFGVTDVTYNPEESIGWRDGYDRGRTAYYCKDLESGEIRLLYEY